jgi:outer membrane receptor protein involved in Fe transport
MLILGSTLVPSMMVGQAAEVDEEVYLLSPFEVTSEGTEGYSTTETLAGTRLRTDLRDLANSISVVNSQVLKDTGATSTQDLLVYTTNTEVGGVSGNFSGLGGGTSFNENNKLLRPSENTRVRGLDAADNTRNYFLTEVPWDGYNVDRVEMQRGPNSVLFGVGSPAGIVNAATKGAVYMDSGSIEMRVGSYGSVRATVDVNRELIDDELAVRIITLYEDTQFQQEPAFEKDERIFAAVRYEPKLFGEGSHTSIRASFEHGDIEANRPRTLPPIDSITPWFKTGTSNGIANLNKGTFDPTTMYDKYYDDPAYNTPAQPSNTIYPWFNEAFMGRMMGSNPAQFFNADSSTPIVSMVGMIGTGKAIGQSGLQDGTIGDMEFIRYFAITGFSNYASKALVDGAYYSDYSLTDASVYDFYNKLIDGNNKREWQEWDAANIAINQTFFDNRVGIDISAFSQRYNDGQYSFLNGGQYVIGVDVNSKLVDGSINPNCGRAYVGNSGYYGNFMNNIDRDSVRGTAYVDLKSTDFLEESWLTRVLGHHYITGLASHDVREVDGRTFSRWAYGTDLTDATGGTASLTGGLRSYDWIAYLGPSMLGSSYTSAKGLNLSNVTATIDPSGTQSVRFFDSTWKGGSNYADPYTYYLYDYQMVLQPTVSQQAENSANYVGWRSQNFSILNASQGDIDQLYTGINKSENTIESFGLTLQSYMLDDCMVFTYGWREDRVRTLSGQAAKIENDVVDSSFVLNRDTGSLNYARGQSRTWGLVLHTPEFINRNLPWGLNFSVFYGEGENFKADIPRGDIYGTQIANPTGETQDYGFVVSALDGRITLKTTWYETKMANATLNASDAGFGSAHLYYAWALPYWEATHALAALDGIADTQLRQGNWGWPWNNIVGSEYKDADGNVTTEGKQRIFAIVQDFFKSIPLDQNFCDQYGIGMNIAAMKAAATNSTFANQAGWSAFYNSVPTYGLNSDTHVYDPISGLGAGNGLALQPAYGGNLKSFGAAPVASCDTTSKGIEWELTARITDNWNVMLNVSKTDATITAVSPSLQNWIATYTEFLAGDAGLIQLWGGDTFRTNWANHILAPYNSLMAKVGSGASEMSPWRFNVITNYNFTEGMFKGVNVGMAYRWEDKRILGYQTMYSTDAQSYVLNLDKPWYGPTEDHFDMWVGYTMALNDDVNWRIQLNLRNVGEDAHLVPVYIQPDGSTGYSRIADGMSWTLSSTFEF